MRKPGRKGVSSPPRAVPLDSPLMIDAEIHEAVMALPPDERRDRTKVNEAVRDGLRLGPLRPAGSKDLYGVVAH